MTPTAVAASAPSAKRRRLPITPARRCADRLPEPRLLLRRVPGAQGHQPRFPRPPGDRADRPLRLRQVDAAAHLQPHLQPLSRAARRRARSSSTGTTSSRPSIDVNELRSRVGMVFQKPTPFPMSIYDNIAFGVRLYEKLSSAELDERVEGALRKAALWDEVKDKLRQSGMGLSGGQQQRLCIARTIAQKPEVILLRRADLGARPDLDRQDRGADRAAAHRVHHRHRDPQHAAGGAHLAVHRLHVSRRADRVRRDRPGSS